jgi:hypothetical protein
MGSAELKQERLHTSRRYITLQSMKPKFIIEGNIYDTDGSLTNGAYNNAVRTNNATVISYFAQKCIKATNQILWNVSLLCDHSVILRSIAFTNAC